jgi:hypothetical protein
MTTLNKNPRSLFFSLAIVVTTYLFSLGAHAGLFYNGYAEIEMNLDNVAVVGSGSGGGNGNNNGNGLGPGDNNYSVTLSGSLLDSGAFSNGSGFATFETSIFPSDNFQFSESYGDSSGTGTASSYADTDFSILFQNNHQNPLRFDLSLFSFVSADINNDAPLLFGDDAGAYAEISLFNNDFTEILFSSAEVFLGGSRLSSEEVEQSLSFELAVGESYELFGTVYSDGYAVTVPEPSMLWLMALGLMTMIVRNNHQRSNTRVKNRN